MSYRLLIGDCREKLRELATGSVQTCVSSPPYWNLRDYNAAGQIGLEPIPDCLAWARREPPCGGCFVCEMRSVYGAELRRVLADDGTVWVNLGDTYAHSTTNNDSFRRGKDKIGSGRSNYCGLPARNLIGIPWRVALALQADGWILRQDIIWHKPNPMPESVTSRCTKSHEYIFLLAKSPKYYFDSEAIQETSAGREPGNTSHKHTADYEAGNEQSRTKGGLVAYAQRQAARPRVNEAERKELRSDTENRHRTAVPGGQSMKSERPQLVRARELAAEAGLTEAHIDAIRACGITDAGKSQHTQNGTGHNTAEVQRLADEAKEVLGGYYREFLTAETRNKRSVWTVATQPYKGAHFATFPPALITPCILAGSRHGDTVLDLFNGSGTTGEVALLHGRHYIGIDINEQYMPLAVERLEGVPAKLKAAEAARKKTALKQAQTTFIDHLQEGATA